MLDDFLEIQVPMLGVNADPVQAHTHRNFGDGRGLKSDPKPERLLSVFQFLLEYLPGTHCYAHEVSLLLS